MTGSTKAWLHGLAGAFLAGAATTAGGVLSAMAFAPKMIWSIEFWATVGGAGLFGGLGGALLYLRQSPMAQPGLPDPATPIQSQAPDKP